MKKTLPLKFNPSVSTCIHHAYPLAIIESEELARAQIIDWDLYDWNIERRKTIVNFSEGEIVVSEEGQGNISDAVLWRECSLEDSASVLIDYLKPQDKRRYIDIFLFSEELSSEMDSEDKMCGVRWNPYGYFIGKDMFSFDTKKYRAVKLAISQSQVFRYASIDGENWEKIDDRPLTECLVGKKLKLGIHFYAGRDFFNIWKNMNFIQLIYNRDDEYKGIDLDYYFFPRKTVDNGYMYYSHFLDTYYDLLYDILDIFVDIRDFIKYCIDHYFYPSIGIDEYYVPQRHSYKKEHYQHYNLFYGYDDERKVFKLMGYSKNSKPVISEISYESVSNDLLTSEKIIRYRFFANENTNLVFSLDSVLQGLYEYINNINSSLKVSNLLTNETLKYGISVLKEFAVDKKSRFKIRDDQRISFCIYEHSKLMRDRVIFLFEEGVLTEETYKPLFEDCEKAIGNSSKIMNLVLKNFIKSTNTEGIDEMLTTQYSLEMNICKQLISHIESYQKSNSF